MRPGLRLILNSSVARRIGKSVLIALIATVTAATFASNPVHASCGDYVMIGGGHEGDPYAGGPTAKTTEKSNVPAPVPCSGPQCKRNSPGAPLTPPVKTNNLESRCFGALFDLALISPGSNRGNWSYETCLVVPDPALSRIFHPPR
jgi:hypothetical protein